MLSSKSLLWFVFVLGCIFSVPIVKQSFEFQLIDCQMNENESSPFYRFEIKDSNETCLQINKTTIDGSEILFYIFQETQPTNIIQIKTDNCSLPIPELSIIQCEKENSTSDFYYVINDIDQQNGTINLQTDYPTTEQPKKDDSSDEDD